MSPYLLTLFCIALIGCASPQQQEQNNNTMTKSTIIMALVCILGMASCHTQLHQPAPPTTEGEAATVYMTTDISPEGLVRIYEALGVETHGRVAVKISTGESSKSNHLRPELIKNLVQKVNGTLVECNTAYGGNRGNTEKHRQACLDLVFNHISSKEDDAKPLQERINKKHGTHTVEYAEQIGLGTRKYTIVSIDNEE